jgi:DNA-binding NarL/FixJ family response regulator
MMPDGPVVSVLIVDDNDLVAQTMARACTVPGIDVVGTAYDAQTTLDAVRRRAPDVVLLDQRLGLDSGLMVARQLLALAPAAKVIMVTGAATPQVQREALDAGCVYCVEKTMEIGRSLPDLVRKAAAGELG